MFDHEAIKELTRSESISAANAAASAVALALLALPADYSVHDLERHLPQRRRARGTMTTSSIEHFAAYVKAHREDGATVFVDSQQITATAVLNLGSPAAPGHADNLAALRLRATAGYAALCKIADGNAKTQRDVAEWLEDWQHAITATDSAEQAMVTRHAIAAVRQITIEAVRRAESSEQSLSATRSALEQVTARSGDKLLPAFLDVTLEPFTGLDSRTFRVRVGVLTGNDKPALVLRVTKAEQHAEDMAHELADKVTAALGGAVPALLGGYAAKS